MADIRVFAKANPRATVEPSATETKSLNIFKNCILENNLFKSFQGCYFPPDPNINWLYGGVYLTQCADLIVENKAIGVDINR